MRVENRWVSYIDKSYQQMKASILSRVTGSNPEMTDHSESNLFIILIDIFCGIGEIINLYLDKLARENFLITSERRSSIIRHALTFDYRIKARNPESVDVIFKFMDEDGNPKNLEDDWIIPSLTTIQNEEGVPFRTEKDITLVKGEHLYTVPMSQFTLFEEVTLGVTNTAKNQKYNLGFDYVHNSITITVGTQNYTRVETFANSLPTSFHYVVDIDTDGIAKVRFGDGVKGIIPAAGNNVIATYKTTLGPDGKIKIGDLDNTSNINIQGVEYTLNTNNPNNSSGGSLYESNEELKNNIPNSIRSLDRMVTYSDHISIVEELPGVARAEVDFCCGKTIDIYIAPTGGGIAQTSLLNSVQEIVEQKKMVATFPVVKAAGETDIILGATITARERVDLVETKTQVEDALVEFGEIENQRINSEIRISDLISLIDNLPNVDYVDLTKITTKPYARPIGHSKTLLWENRKVTTSAIKKVKWKVEYLNSSIRIFSNEVYLGQVGINETYVAPDNSISFKINDGAYDDGDRWEFIVYPYNQNIILDDFTVPSIKVENLEILVEPAKNRSRNRSC